MWSKNSANSSFLISCVYNKNFWRSFRNPKYPSNIVEIIDNHGIFSESSIENHRRVAIGKLILTEIGSFCTWKFTEQTFRQGAKLLPRNYEEALFCNWRNGNRAVTY